MPTGFTAILDESETEVTLEQFALRCARGMGALIMLRDEPLDAPIPERFEVDPYFAKRIDTARAELEKARALSDAEAGELLKNAIAVEQADVDRYVKETERVRARYAAMRAKVEAWNPPSDEHLGLKRFMLEQLKTGNPYEASSLVGRGKWPSTGAAYRLELIERAERALAYAEVEHEKEKGRTANRNAWVIALRASLRGVP